jgi:hypothetical protein
MGRVFIVLREIDDEKTKKGQDARPLKAEN